MVKGEDNMTNQTHLNAVGEATELLSNLKENGTIYIDSNDLIKALSVEEVSTQFVKIETGLFGSEPTVEEFKTEVEEMYANDYFSYSLDHEVINTDELINVLNKNGIKFTLKAE
jgi:hypothetical protein